MIGEQGDGFAVAVQRPHINVRRTRRHRACAAAAGDPLVHHRADVVVRPSPLEPHLAQLREHARAQLERAPDPVRPRGRRLDLHFLDVPLLVHHHRVEKLRPLDGEAEERQIVVAEGLESRLRKPDRVGQSHQHLLLGRDERQRVKERVAQPVRLLLHRVAERGLPDAAAKVRHDVRLARRDHEADARGAGDEHAVEQILGDRAGPLRRAVEARADRQQLLAECERLDPASDAGGWNDSPHAITPPRTPRASAVPARRSCARP